MWNILNPIQVPIITADQCYFVEQLKIMEMLPSATNAMRHTYMWCEEYCEERSHQVIDPLYVSAGRVSQSPNEKYPLKQLYVQAADVKME